MTNNNTFSLHLPPLSVTSVLLSSSSVNAIMPSLNHQLNLNVFPNPAGDFLTLEMNLPENIPAEITFMDVLGRVLINKSIQTNKIGYSFYKMNLPDLKDGIYILRVKAEGNTGQKKIFIKKPQ